MKQDRNTTPILTNDRMPHDERLEAAVLGALLVEANYVPDVRGILTADAFYNSDNAVIYEAICRLDDEGRTVDMLSVVRAVKDANISAAYVADLTQSIGTGVAVLNRARYLADLQTLRMLIVYAAELTAKAQSDNNALDWALSELDVIAGKAVCVDAARHIVDVLQETLQDLERRQKAHQQGECVGIPTGLSYLDAVTGGWRGGQLVVLAARPAMGKTAVSLHFARSAAMAGVPVCFFSLEMPDAQLAGRMLVGASGVDANAFRRGSIVSKDWEMIERGADDLRGLPLYLFDTPSISMPRIRAQARAMQRRGRCGMVVVDYLQLIEGSDDRRTVNREREVAQMSRAAKMLAKELSVPVVLLSQLSRKVEERADKTPMLSDLRESGAIEQDADMVIFIDRPAVYSTEPFDAGSRYRTVDPQGVGRLTIAKNREGGTGLILFRHNKSLTRITDYETDTMTTDQSDNAPY